MQHAFPHDYRSGPEKTDWDPSKWIIVALAKLGVAWGLRRATIEDIAAARAHMLTNRHDQNAARERVVENKEWTRPTWTEAELEAYIKRRSGACVVLIDGYAVDVTRYLKAHPGGVRLLRDYAFPVEGGGECSKWKEAGWAFNGGVNRHSQAARRRMSQLRVARIVGYPDR